LMKDVIFSILVNTFLLLFSFFYVFFGIFHFQFYYPLESKNKIAVSAKTVRYFLPIGIFRQRKLNFLSLFFSVCFFFFEPRDYSFSFVFFFFHCYAPIILKNYYLLSIFLVIFCIFTLFIFYV